MNLGLRYVWFLALVEVVRRREWRAVVCAAGNVLALQPSLAWYTGAPILNPFD